MSVRPFPDVLALPLTARRRRGLDRLPSVLGLVIALQLLLSAVAILTHDGSSSGPVHPDRWDPRVTDLARFVEKERGLKFDHPVHVDFLTGAAYTKQTTAEEDGVADDRRAELDRQAGELRALGLASGNVDLFAAYNSVSDGGTLAFYNPLDDRVRVRGTKLTIGLRVTLVHELTHALQDQHFDLDRLYADGLDSSAATSFRALIEGDALRVEDAYTDGELSTKEKADYTAEYAAAVEKGTESTSDVPPFVTATFNVPYLLGRPFVSMLFNIGGNSEVNDAFGHPPTTGEHLFDPASFLADETSVEVDAGNSEAVKVIDSGPFGSADWYLLLAERIDPKVALDAALGWAGDTYTTYKRGGRSCVRATFAGDSKRDEQEMRKALKTWVYELPGDKAEVTEVDGHPGFEACDPGEEVDMRLTGRSMDSLYVPSLWSYLIADAATELDAEGSRCYAHDVVAALTYEQMTDPTGATFTSDEFQTMLNDAFESCV